MFAVRLDPSKKKLVDGRRRASADEANGRKAGHAQIDFLTVSSLCICSEVALCPGEFEFARIQNVLMRRISSMRSAAANS